jgi:hypothetical protein
MALARPGKEDQRLSWPNRPQGLDKPETVKGAPYDRSIQVIVTDEFTPNQHMVEAFLTEEGAVEGFNIGMNSGEVAGQTVMGSQGASWSGLQHPHSGTPRPSGASTPSGP